MRICYLCSDSGVELSRYNGSAAHVRALVGAFVELGHEVDLLMARTGGAEELGVNVRAIPPPGFARPLAGLARRSRNREDDGERDTAVLRALRRIWNNSAVERVLEDQLSRQPPDLIYERYSPFAVAGAVVARRLGLPHLLEVNAPLAWEGKVHRGQALNEAAELLECLAFDASTRIVAVSEELRATLIDGGVDAEKIGVVPNGVDHRRFAADGPVLPAGLGEKVVVGFVGSLKGWHGIDRLVESFEKLAADPRLHLLVVGDGPMADVVRDSASRNPGRITLTGEVHPSDVPAHLRAIDIAVAPYPELERFYFSPLKVLEYMAAGRAVVASRIGQLERIVEHGETGLLVEPGDAGALINAVQQLAADPAMRQRLGRRAAEEIQRSHLWTQRAEQILALDAAGV